MIQQLFSLSNILEAALGFLGGLWAATYLQDRDTRRRQLGIVRALRAEVARIRREGRLDLAQAISISVFGATPVLPSPGSWVDALLSDVASTSAEIVTQYLELDRCLHNLRSFAGVESAAGKALAGATDELQRAEEKFEASPIKELGDAIIAVTKAKNAIERAELDADLAEHLAQTAWTNARNAIASLDGTLSAVEADLSRGLFTHLPWHRLGRR